LGQPVLDSRQLGGEGAEALARGAEGIAVFVEVLLPPANRPLSWSTTMVEHLWWRL